MAIKILKEHFIVPILASSSIAHPNSSLHHDEYCIMVSPRRDFRCYAEAYDCPPVYIEYPHHTIHRMIIA